MTLEVKKIQCVSKAARQQQQGAGQTRTACRVQTLPNKYWAKRNSRLCSTPGLRQLLCILCNTYSLTEHLYIQGLYVKYWDRQQRKIKDLDLELRFFVLTY